MYRFAVYDTDTKKTEKLLTILKALLLEKGIKKFSYMHIQSWNNSKSWPIQADDCQILFISLNMPDSTEVAYSVLQKNPFCRIIFYGEPHVNINELLKCRPAAILTDDTDNLKKQMRFEIFDNISNHAVFFETRSAQVVLPIKNTLYFYSQQHYINVISNKEALNERFKGKLDDLQGVVNGRIFIRIHKSYLISLLHLVKVDKKEHFVLMDNGDELPISDFYYRDVINTVREFCPFKV